MASTISGSGAPVPREQRVSRKLERRGCAVVSCHVERMLDDEVWKRYRRLIARRPGGFSITSLMRPPAEGEDSAVFLERAQEAARLGPIGHHIHWTSATHARPTGGDPAAAVRKEGVWLREQGVAARFFCGGGWYIDAEVMGAVADLGYTDCTATAWRPPTLAAGAPRASLAQPALVRLEDRRTVLELPTTHSLGAAARSLLRPLPPVVHIHFHDYDLLDGRRSAALSLLLVALGRRREPVAIDALRAEREVEWRELVAS